MTWSMETHEPVVHGEHITMVLNFQTFPAGVEPAFKEQVAMATAAVDLLAQAVGRPHDKLVVTVRGHANPDHAPKRGYGPEYLQITITAVPDA